MTHCVSDFFRLSMVPETRYVFNDLSSKGDAPIPFKAKLVGFDERRLILLKEERAKFVEELSKKQNEIGRSFDAVRAFSDQLNQQRGKLSALESQLERLKNPKTACDELSRLLIGYVPATWPLPFPKELVEENIKNTQFAIDLLQKGCTSSMERILQTQKEMGNLDSEFKQIERRLLGKGAEIAILEKQLEPIRDFKQSANQLIYPS